MDNSIEERWATWWCNPWAWTHADWKSCFTHERGLAVADFLPLTRFRHEGFLWATGIAPSQPPEPAVNLLRWLALTSDQRDQALLLARRICFVHAPALDVQSTLHSRSDIGLHEPWCRSVAKALQPGGWLGALDPDPRLLLGAWVGPHCWSRLRLMWAPGEIGELACNLPLSKLHSLWHAIFWRVGTLQVSST